MNVYLICQEGEIKKSKAQSHGAACFSCASVFVLFLLIFYGHNQTFSWSGNAAGWLTLSNWISDYFSTSPKLIIQLRQNKSDPDCFILIKIFFWNTKLLKSLYNYTCRLFAMFFYDYYCFLKLKYSQESYKFAQRHSLVWSPDHNILNT